MKSRQLDLVDKTGTPESVYAEKYQWLLRWAMHFCSGDREMAEDLVQDTFVRMLSSWSSIRDAAHPERFLYSYLRYGFLRRRSSDQRQSFQPLSSIDIELLEFRSDRGYTGLMEWQEEIHAVVDFLCRRKATTKSASMLLLRFFHGFFPSEIMLIARLPRKAVDDGLANARLEVKAYIADPGACTSRVGVEPPAAPRMVRSVPSIEDFMRQMVQVILAVDTGNCLSISALEMRYDEECRTAIDCWLLSHIVSCARCLEVVERRAGLPPRGSRPLEDVLGYAPKDVLGTKDRAASKRAAMRSMMGARERYREVREHTPRSIMLFADGKRVASRDVCGSMNELSIDIKSNELPELIEVMSEQCLLLTVPTDSAPVEAAPVQHFEADLSDGRRVSLSLDFMPTCVRVLVTYEDPLAPPKKSLSEVGISFRQRASVEAENQRERQDSLWNKLLHWIRRPSGGGLKLAFCCFVLSGLGIAGWHYLNRPRPEKILDSAVKEIARMPASGVELQQVRISAKGNSFVETLHRDLSNRRRPKRGKVPAEQLEVESELAAAEIGWADPLSPVAFQDWRERQHNASDSVISHDGQLLTLTTAVPTGLVREASLTVRADTFHTVGRTVRFNNNDVIEIAELDDKVLPWTKSDPEWFEPLGAGTVTDEHSTRVPLATRARMALAPTQDELNEAELGVRLALLELNADAQERLSIDRKESGIVVEGLVATEERKQEITRRLRSVPHAISAIRTFAQFEASSATGTSPTGVVMVSSSDGLTPLDTLATDRHIGVENVRAVHGMLLNAAFSLNKSAIALRDLASRFHQDALSKEATSLYASLAEQYSSRARSAMAEEARALALLREQPQSASTSNRPATTPPFEMALQNAQLCFELISSQASGSRPAQDIAHDLASSLSALERASEAGFSHSQSLSAIRAVPANSMGVNDGRTADGRRTKE